MRVLMVSDFYPPIIGGLELYVQALARELVRRGHEVAVATQWREGSPAFEIDEGVRIHRLVGWSRALAAFYENTDRQFHPTAPDPGMMVALRRVVAIERPDVVHAHGWMLYSFLPLKPLSKAKLVVTLHDYGLVCPKKTYMHNGRSCEGPALAECLPCASRQYGRVKSAALTTGLHLSRRLHSRVDRYLAVSGSVRAASLAGAGQPPRPIDVVPSFISDNALDEVTQVGRPSFLPPHDDYILFVGQLGAHKGLNVLLDAYNGLAEQAPLVVVGTECPDTPAQFPPGVIVVRNVPHPQVMAAWAHCAVAVVPSVWPEPQPLVTIEAMSCGKPVVASAVGGLRDMVLDGETGLLVPPGDATALREALHGLLSDQARRARLGEAARQRSCLYMASTVTERIEQIYGEVLAA